VQINRTSKKSFGREIILREKGRYTNFDNHLPRMTINLAFNFMKRKSLSRCIKCVHRLYRETVGLWRNLTIIIIYSQKIRLVPTTLNADGFIHIKGNSQKMHFSFQSLPSLHTSAEFHVYTVGQKVSCCIASCNFVDYGPIQRNSTVRNFTKFQERCILL